MEVSARTIAFQRRAYTHLSFTGTNFTTHSRPLTSIAGEQRRIRCLYRPNDKLTIITTPTAICPRWFTLSSRQLKKGGREQGTKNAAAATDDPFDFGVLEKDITAALERLKQDLSKLRSGGRFNHEVLENLRVQVDKSSNSKVTLSDLAQVIPKGRTIHIIVGDKEHLKAVSSAIQGSDLSLTPQPDSTGSNPLLLEIKIPPPTAETRQAAVKEAVKAGDKASVAIRDARAKQNKAHRKMELAKTARSDDLNKAGKQMEKIVEQAQADAKKTVDGAKKMLESS